MGIFSDKLNKYNAQAEKKVNPPEAAPVLVEKTEPETRGEFVPSDNDSPKAPSPTSATSSVDSPAEGAGVVELTRGQKAAATRARNRSATASTADASKDTQVTSELSASGQSIGDLTTEQLVAELKDRGYVVSLTVSF